MVETGLRLILSGMPPGRALLARLLLPLLLRQGLGLLFSSAYFNSVFNGIQQLHFR